MNLYAYAGNNPIAYTDPFGLCPDPSDPACPRQGAVLSISFGGSAGVGVIGSNFQVGLAINSNLDMMGYVKGGPSAAIGVMAGAQVGMQKGSLNDLLAPAGEYGDGLSAVVAPVVAWPSLTANFGEHWGLAVGGKGGAGVSLDISNGGLGTGTANLRTIAKEVWSYVKQAGRDFFTASIQGPAE